MSAAPLWLPEEVWGALPTLASELLARRWRLATAESCTGGLVAAACTARAGSSDWFERGWVTYSNAAKTAELGVPPELIAQYGAVSAPVATAMAAAAAARAGVQVALAITGIAGPGGATPSKPVGTVWFGFAVAGQVQAECCHFEGDRAAVRAQAAAHALVGIVQRLAGLG